MASIKQKDPEVTRRDLAAREERRQREAAMAAKRRELWSALNEYIHHRGGYVISPPHAQPLYVEIPQTSTLGNELADLGYDITPAGTTTHITGGQFVPVNVFTLRIPLGK